MPVTNVGGVKLYYEMEGSGAETILFLHGLGSSGASWELQKPAFSGRYRLLLVDVRGHGRSAKPPGPYSIPQFAQDILQLLDHLGLAQVHVVGLSMGGMIGFQLAVAAPQRIRSLTVCNSGPELVARSLGDRFKLWQRLLWLRFLPMHRVGAAIGGRLFPHPQQAPLREHFLAEFRRNPRRAYQASFRALLGWSVRAALPQLTLPVLVISGDMDYTPVAQKEAYVREIPGAQLVVIENSRHATPADQPDAFNQALAAFLERVGGP